MLYLSKNRRDLLNWEENFSHFIRGYSRIPKVGKFENAAKRSVRIEIHAAPSIGERLQTVYIINFCNPKITMSRGVGSHCSKFSVAVY